MTDKVSDGLRAIVPDEPSKRGRWRWTVVNGDGKVVAISPVHGLESKADAQAMADRVVNGPLVVFEELTVEPERARSGEVLALLVCGVAIGMAVLGLLWPWMRENFGGFM